MPEDDPSLGLPPRADYSALIGAVCFNCPALLGTDPGSRREAGVSQLSAGGEAQVVHVAVRDGYKNLVQVVIKPGVSQESVAGCHANPRRRPSATGRIVLYPCQAGLERFGPGHKRMSEA